MKNPKILVISSHPDDELLGCGGMMADAIKNGIEVEILIISQGRNSPLDQRLDTIPLVDIITQIEKKIAKFQPTIVYTHFLYDLNRDHQIVSEATRVACRPSSGVLELYSYEVLSSTELGLQPFQPDTYKILTKEDIELKIQAMKNVYGSELREYPHPRSISAIKTKARSRGAECECFFAEAFQTIRRVA